MSNPETQVTLDTRQKNEDRQLKNQKGKTNSKEN